ncbi:pentatricopeptide repeat-containing protein [Pyrus ussuriensis x Pyrus communis]|uniref:Pentatricopeptide repeat-containing protein n=1 Tax=Pyrus ussuriensis x Pyrus communis TaxID=2448454 RepID=A0A5N5GGQ0_9ROSA|nr:pentatricopeptide repeat-containing protein [Pyrus ussuriensis x Pyrus communis]
MRVMSLKPMLFKSLKSTCHEEPRPYYYSPRYPVEEEPLPYYHSPRYPVEQEPMPYYLLEVEPRSYYYSPRYPVEECKVEVGERRGTCAREGLGSGFGSNVFVQTSSVNLYATSGKSGSGVEYARQVFDDAKKKHCLMDQHHHLVCKTRSRGGSSSYLSLGLQNKVAGLIS